MAAFLRYPPIAPYNLGIALEVCPSTALLWQGESITKGGS